MRTTKHYALIPCEDRIELCEFDGTFDEGINAHIRSWNNDVEAWLHADKDGNDRLSLSIPEGLPVIINGRSVEAVQ